MPLMFRSLAFLLTLCTFTLLSLRASADFTSTFDIPVGNGTYMADGPVGNWYLTTASSGGAAYLSTISAPSSVSLTGYATGPGSASSATLEFPSFAQAGTVDVDFDFSAGATSGNTPSTATFTILVDGVSVDTYSSSNISTAEIPVLAGDSLSFYVNGTGGIILPPPTVTILTGTAAVTLSNFTFTPVPEPAATAAFACMVTLGAATIFRRRRLRSA
jgi:hypothetical protein